MRTLSVLVAALCLGWVAAAQTSPPSDQSQSTQSTQEEQQKSLDRSKEAGESSSRDTRIDLSPPKDDAKNHPGGAAEDKPDTSDVGEMHPWNPLRAGNDDDVGDFYMKQQNYKGAIARFQDALVYKDNDAIAHFRLGQCFEKTNQPDEAIPQYQAYLKILPHGPYAKQAKKALEKLKAPVKPANESEGPKP